MISKQAPRWKDIVHSVWVFASTQHNSIIAVTLDVANWNIYYSIYGKNLQSLMKNKKSGNHSIRSKCK